MTRARLMNINVHPNWHDTRHAAYIHRSVQTSFGDWRVILDGGHADLFVHADPTLIVCDMRTDQTLKRRLHIIQAVRMMETDPEHDTLIHSLI